MTKYWFLLPGGGGSFPEIHIFLHRPNIVSHALHALYNGLSLFHGEESGPCDGVKNFFVWFDINSWQKLMTENHDRNSWQKLMHTGIEIGVSWKLLLVLNDSTFTTWRVNRGFFLNESILEHLASTLQSQLQGKLFSVWMWYFSTLRLAVRFARVFVTGLVERVNMLWGRHHAVWSTFRGLNRFFCEIWDKHNFRSTDHQIAFRGGESNFSQILYLLTSSCRHVESFW